MCSQGCEVAALRKREWTATIDHLQQWRADVETRPIDFINSNPGGSRPTAPRSCTTRESRKIPKIRPKIRSRSWEIALCQSRNAPGQGNRRIAETKDWRRGGCTAGATAGANGQRDGKRVMYKKESWRAAMEVRLEPKDRALFSLQRGSAVRAPHRHHLRHRIVLMRSSAVSVLPGLVAHMVDVK
jgi:hypothetical protein